MPAIRGRTITSFGQLFPTLSGGVTGAPPIPPDPPTPALANVGGSGVRTATNWRSIISPRERRIFLGAIFPDEVNKLSEKELAQIMSILDILDETDLQ